MTKPNTPLLDKIVVPEDLRKLDERQLPQVADELRLELIDAVSQTGGHLGAGLGVVELLRMAIYLVFAVVLISAVRSWVSPHAPAAPLFHGFAAPFLRPFRRIVPMIANVDLSPLVLLLVLQIVLVVVSSLRANFIPLLVAG